MKRFLLILASVFVTLICVEATLPGHIAKVNLLEWFWYDPTIGWKSNYGHPLRAEILTVGDSFTEGAGVKRTEAWPIVLGKLLGKVVRNEGVGGYGLDQMYLRASETITPSTKHLLIGVIPNDVYRCGVKRFWAPKSYYELHDGSLTLKGTPVPKEFHLRLLALWRRAANREMVPTGQDATAVARALVARFSLLPVPDIKLVLYSNDADTAPLLGAGLPVINCGQIPEPGLLTREEDQWRHPNPVGQRWIADCVAAELRETK